MLSLHRENPAPPSDAFAALPVLTPEKAEGLPLSTLQIQFFKATNLLRMRHEDGALPPDFPARVGMDEVTLLEREEMLQALRDHAALYSSALLVNG